MSKISNFESEALRCERWLYDGALPFWSEFGIDRKFGGFNERLDLKGHPIDLGYKRTRVAGRQIYVFCQAYQAGQKQYHGVIERGVDFLLRFQKGERNGVWRRSVTSSGEKLDDTIDLYDFSFVLFGLAWWYRISSDNNAKNLAVETLNFIKFELVHPSGLGYCHVKNLGEPYQQNPHMHLMESLIEWFDITQDQLFRDELDQLFNLFKNKFFFQGTLREYFDSNWLPMSSREGLFIEPGHMAEWAWILKRFAILSEGNQDKIISELMKFVKECQQKSDIGLLVDRVRPDYEVEKPDTRLWPQTETIKGLIAESSHYDSPNTELICGHINKIFEVFLDPAPPGCWIDHLDGYGNQIVDYIPASSLYHVACSFQEIVSCSNTQKKRIRL